MRPGHHGLVAVSGTYRDHYRHAVGLAAASTSFVGAVGKKTWMTGLRRS